MSLASLIAHSRSKDEELDEIEINPSRRASGFNSPTLSRAASSSSTNPSSPSFSRAASASTSSRRRLLEEDSLNASDPTEEEGADTYRTEDRADGEEGGTFSDTPSLSTLDRLCLSLPSPCRPTVVQLNHKGFIIGSVVLLAFILFLVFMSVFYPGRIPGGETPVDYSLPPKTAPPEFAVTRTIRLGPFVLPQMGHWMQDDLEVLALPSKKDFVIHEMYFQVTDEKNKTLLNSQVYVHHCILRDITQPNKFNMVWGFGAESTKSPLSFPSPYARFVNHTDVWSASAHLIPLWGGAAVTNLSVFINFTFVITEFDEKHKTGPSRKDFEDVEYYVTGINLRKQAEFDVPEANASDPEPHIYCKSQTISWDGSDDQTMVVALGHIHIGSINLTLVDQTRIDNGSASASTSATSSSLIVAALPTYDDCAFVKKVGGGYPNYRFLNGNNYTITACYQNDRAYGEVMAIWQAYFTLPPIQDDDKSGSGDKRNRRTREPEEEVKKKGAHWDWNYALQKVGGRKQKWH